MPANAGTQVRFRSEEKTAWIPSYGGMTEIEVDFQSTNSEPLGLEPRVVQFTLELSSHQNLTRFARHAANRVIVAVDHLGESLNAARAKNLVPEGISLHREK